jgi:tight adherence protein B
MSSAHVAGAILGLIAGAGLLLVLAAATGSHARSRPHRVGRLRRLLRAAGLPQVSSASVVAVCLGSGLVLGLLALLITAVPMAAVLAGVCAANAPLIVLRRRARQRTLALRRSWPEAVDTLVSAIRAGMSLPEAVIELSRCGPEPLREACAGFAAEYRATGSFTVALDVLQEALSDPVADRVIASLRIARDVGGSDLGVVLRTLSALLREDARTRGEIEARQSWTVSAARLAVAAPWITLALLCSRAEAIRAYASASGAFVLLCAATLSWIAYRLMLRIGRLPVEVRLAP